MTLDYQSPQPRKFRLKWVLIIGISALVIVYMVFVAGMYTVAPVAGPKRLPPVTPASPTPAPTSKPVSG